MSHIEPAANTVTGPATAIISVRPVVLEAPDRGTDLQLRVSAPVNGQDLPVVLFSHGLGFSMDAYGPIVDFWAAHGFVVIQPTHLDSVALGLAPDDPRGPNVWRYRIEDLRRVLDELGTIEASVPGLRARLDYGRIAATGHSYGATSASALLGARVLAPGGDPEEDFTDSRVMAGVLLCLAGLAGNELTPLATQMFSFMSPKFDHMNTPALIGAGDADQSMLSTRGPDWWRDGYQLSPGEKSLLTLAGAEHGLGGIHAYGTIPQSPAENPATVALVQQVTTAYLRSVLKVDEASYPTVRDALAFDAAPIGHLESK